jgi:glycosyltransferase involved in cell wall biosynthesis
MTFSRAEERAVESVLENFRPTIVHLHNAYPAFGPAIHLAAERHGIPVVMTVHNLRLRCPNGYMFTEGELCRRCENGAYLNSITHHCFSSRSQAGAYAISLWTHRFLLRLEHRVSMFMTPSEFLRERLLQWGIPHERISVVPNFTPSQAATPAPGRYGAYVGRLSGEKGLDVLLHALRATDDPAFRIIGDGPLREELEVVARELGLHNTTFTGRLSRRELASMLGEARFIVIPSMAEENAPLAALEAMAAGRPLLVSERGGLPELAGCGAGVVFRPGDVGDLASKIQKLNASNSLCRRLGERGLAAARSRYSPEAHVRLLENVYESVASTASYAQGVKRGRRNRARRSVGHSQT